MIKRFYSFIFCRYLRLAPKRLPRCRANISFLSVAHRCINGKSTRLIRTIIGGRTLFGLRVYAPNNCEPSSDRTQRSLGSFTDRVMKIAPNRSEERRVGKEGSTRRQT